MLEYVSFLLRVLVVLFCASNFVFAQNTTLPISPTDRQAVVPSPLSNSQTAPTDLNAQIYQLQSDMRVLEEQLQILQTLLAQLSSDDRANAFLNPSTATPSEGGDRAIYLAPKSELGANSIALTVPTGSSLGAASAPMTGGLLSPGTGPNTGVGVNGLGNTPSTNSTPSIGGLAGASSTSSTGLLGTMSAQSPTPATSSSFPSTSPLTTPLATPLATPGGGLSTGGPATGLGNNVLGAASSPTLGNGNTFGGNLPIAPIPGGSSTLGTLNTNPTLTPGLGASSSGPITLITPIQSGGQAPAYAQVAQPFTPITAPVPGGGNPTIPSNPASQAQTQFFNSLSTPQAQANNALLASPNAAVSNPLANNVSPNQTLANSPNGLITPTPSAPTSPFETSDTADQAGGQATNQLTNQNEFYLQVGAFSDLNNASARKAQIEQGFQIPVQLITGNDGITRLLMGPFDMQTLDTLRSQFRANRIEFVTRR